MNEIDEIYTDVILELYKHPLNKGILENYDIACKDINPFCGDVIEMQIKFDNNKIDEILFQGQGCAISQASASFLTEMVKGKNINDILKLSVDDLLYELNLGNLRRNPMRIKCAALSLKVLKNSLIKYLNKNNK